jgi:hypothetical protein
MNGCLQWFQPVMKVRILIMRSRTRRKVPRRMAWRSMMPNQTSTKRPHQQIHAHASPPGGQEAATLLLTVTDAASWNPRLIKQVAFFGTVPGRCTGRPANLALIDPATYALRAQTSGRAASAWV